MAHRISSLNWHNQWGEVIDSKISPNRKEIILLGFFTWVAFLSTIYGIRLIGAPIFNLVEHALIPISMAYFATKLLFEKFSLQMRLGFIISSFSVLIFMSRGIHLNAFIDGANWVCGILLAIIGSILTALTSVTHKKFSTQFEPEEFLILRFTIPTLALAAMLLLRQPTSITLMQLFQLVVTAIFGFGLPLVCLCFGFVKSSLARFSGFILLVPFYTFILGEILIGDTTSQLTEPVSIIGICGLIFGYVVFEWTSLRKIALSFPAKYLIQKLKFFGGPL
jgi:drug/metabolite transporter (DMT)-like permease